MLRLDLGWFRTLDTDRFVILTHPRPDALRPRVPELVDISWCEIHFWGFNWYIMWHISMKPPIIWYFYICFTIFQDAHDVICIVIYIIYYIYIAVTTDPESPWFAGRWPWVWQHDSHGGLDAGGQLRYPRARNLT